MENFKVMVTVDSDNVIWNMVTEVNIMSNHPIYDLLSKEIDLLKWKEKYLVLYNSWLESDDSSIYNINHPINMDIINALIILNKKNTDLKLYYWFDVDRDINSDYVWQKCPLSEENLILLPGTFNCNNGKISPVFPLVFPRSE